MQAHLRSSGALTVVAEHAVKVIRCVLALRHVANVDEVIRLGFPLGLVATCAVVNDLGAQSRLRTAVQHVLLIGLARSCCAWSNLLGEHDSWTPLRTYLVHE